MTYSELNLKTEYPPPCEQIIWDYTKANSQTINKAIEGFNQEELFLDKDIDGRLFNKTVVNICHKYIPNKYATFNDKDPNWLNDHISLSIKIHKAELAD